MKTNKWPKEVHIFLLAQFITGVELMGPILLIFFKDWGGLNQTETQTLQSWFMLCIFILEIPTGVFGDVKGKKYSTILGYILLSVGCLTYSLIPNIWLFLISEFIFALGVAFISGAEEAWLYDITNKFGLKEDYRQISATCNNLRLIGMILASIIYIPIAKVLPVQHIFKLGILTNGIALLLLGIFVPSTDGLREGSLKPNYLETAKNGFKLLKNNLNLRKLAIYLSMIYSTSYFVVWLYQETLRVLGQTEEMFGVYRVILLVAQIVLLRAGSFLIDKCKFKKIYISIAVVVSIGFLLAAITKNIVGVLFLLIFSGGVGLQARNLLSKEINEEIRDEERATVLSFVSMVRRVSLTIFNPFIGFIVDSKGVFVAFTFLGIISLFSIFLKPRFKHKN